MSTVAILGAGLVGGAMIRDLAGDDGTAVIAADFNETALDALTGIPSVTCRQMDLLGPGHLSDVVAEADLVVCAVPGSMGYRTLDTLIEQKKNVVDISFCPENALDLDARARESGVTVITDCGVAPGLCNLQAGFVKSTCDSILSYTCYVGGLPRVRTLPWEYKAVFSPSDVIEEYVRPARFVENGTLVIRKALTDVEPVEFPEVGTLEAFNTDGLRSLIDTLGAPDMKEKTLRYPGHADLVRTFRDAGFFNPEPVQTRAGTVRPLDVTSRLLFDAWKLKPGEEDVTVMRVIIDAETSGTVTRHTFDLFDVYDAGTGVHSMARTTGYTCTSVARLALAGRLEQPGVHPPEYVGELDGCYQAVLDDLKHRNIHVTQTSIKL